MIVPVDYRNFLQLQALSALHKSLLPDGFVTKLGEEFLRKYYYYTLLKARKMKSILYYAEGSYVGFISYTTEPFSMYVKKRYLFYLLIKALLKKPALIALMLEVLFLRRKKKPEPKWGETLSMGVLPAYRRCEGGIGLKLYRYALDELKKAGMTHSFAFVRKNKVRLKMHMHFGGVAIELGKDTVLMETKL